MKSIGPFLIVAVLCTWVTYAARPLSGSIYFVYDPNSGYFSAISTSKCYLVKTTRIEREHLRSSVGLQEIELKMMREWVGVLNETIVLHTDNSLPNYFQSRCAGQDIYFLHRNLAPESTASSILG